MIYTPILIKFVSPVVVDGEATQPTHLQPLRLVITAPVSRLRSAEQTLALPTVVTIPYDQELRLRLVPSSCYDPHGRYDVKVFQGKNNQVPVAQMTWVVPEAPAQRKIDVVATGAIDAVNVAFFEVTEVSHAGTYRVEASQIIWEADPPTEGAIYHVTYVPAVTLGDLMVNNPA